MGGGRAESVGQHAHLEPSHGCRLHLLEELTARGVVLENVGLKQDLLPGGLAGLAHGGEGVAAVEEDVHPVSPEERRAVDAPHQELEAGVRETLWQRGGELLDAPHP